MRSVSLMLCPVPKPLGAPLHLISGSVTMADRVVLKQHPRWQEPLDRFSDHGRSGGSQTKREVLPHQPLFSNHGRSSGSQTPVLGSLPNISSATMADRAVLKQRGGRRRRHVRSVTMADRAVLKPVSVDMPFDLGISISKNCKICQVFLFLRPAQSFFRSGSRISASVIFPPRRRYGSIIAERSSACSSYRTQPWLHSR